MNLANGKVTRVGFLAKKEYVVCTAPGKRSLTVAKEDKGFTAWVGVGNSWSEGLLKSFKTPAKAFEAAVANFW